MANPLAALKAKPEEEDDNPPGAPAYPSGPLAIQPFQPSPKPTPQPGDDKKRRY